MIQVPLFLGLNIMDAILTNKCLEAGAAEMMPLASLAGSNLLLWKWLVPVGIVAGLHYKEKMNLLKPLNIAMGAIVIWNTLVLSNVGG